MNENNLQGECYLAVELPAPTLVTAQRVYITVTAAPFHLNSPVGSPIYAIHQPRNVLSYEVF